jgi:predicted O-methyltransferase YrrM
VPWALEHTRYVPMPATLDRSLPPGRTGRLLRLQKKLERLPVSRLHRPVERVEALWRGFWNRWLSRHLARTPGYAFTADYVAQHEPVWSEHLAHLRGAHNTRLLEVGSFEGRASTWFLENVLTHPTATLTCVDPFGYPGAEARFDHNVRASGHAARLRKIKGKSEAVLLHLEPASYDAVYIDGSHLAVNVLMDAVLGWRLMKPGGVLIFDDYLWRPDYPLWRRPQVAIDLFLDLVGADAAVLHKARQVIVRKALGGGQGTGSVR